MTYIGGIQNGDVVNMVTVEGLLNVRECSYIEAWTVFNAPEHSQLTKNHKATFLFTLIIFVNQSKQTSRKIYVLFIYTF